MENLARPGSGKDPGQGREDNRIGSVLSILAGSVPDYLGGLAGINVVDPVFLCATAPLRDNVFLCCQKDVGT